MLQYQKLTSFLIARKCIFRELLHWDSSLHVEWILMIQIQLDCILTDKYKCWIDNVMNDHCWLEIKHKYWQTIYIFSLEKDKQIRVHKVTILKEQCRLDIQKYSSSQRTINERNRLLINYAKPSYVNIINLNRIDKYLGRDTFKKGWARPFVLWMARLINLVQSC